MWWLLAGLAFVILWWLLARMRSYQKLFALAHVMEFARALPALKQAAMQNVMTGDGWVAPPPDGPRILRTSAGLVFVYTIGIDPAGKYVHHASVSVPGGVTAHAVGEMFILLWARLLGVGCERLVLQMSPATVHHAEFVLDEGEQAEFAQRVVEAATADKLKALQAECLRVRQNMRRGPRLAAAGL
jgi:hypothetical protein